VTLELKQIKIQESSKWDKSQATEFEHDERCVTKPVDFETMDDLIAGKKITNDKISDTITIDETVQVTFYRM